MKLEVRGIRTGRRFPARAAVYTRASLPSSWSSVASTQLPALRTAPAVDLPRSSETSLPNNSKTYAFDASAHALASVLHQAEQLLVELWCKDPYAHDSMLGVAAISLSRLLDRRSLDGWAPVLASSSSAQKQIQLAEVHVYISLDEVGPPSSSVQSASQQQQQDNASSPPLEHGGEQHRTATNGDDSPTYTEDDPVASTQAAFNSQRQEDAASLNHAITAKRADDSGTASTSEPMKNEKGASASQKHYAYASGASQSINGSPYFAQGKPEGLDASQAADVRSTPEYEVAWQLEEWKRREKERFEEELKQKESERMATLEEAWRQAEETRADEHTRALKSLKQEHAKLSEKLERVQARERELISQYSKVSQERETEKRDTASKLHEAQEAVRRVQSESEHKLALERERVQELEKQRKREEQRADAAEKRRNDVINELEQFRRNARQEPEAVLQADLAKQREARERAEQKLVRTQRARDKYKEQLRKLARELAARTYQSPHGVSHTSGERDSSLLPASSREAHQDVKRQEMHEVNADRRIERNETVDSDSADGEPGEDAYSRTVEHANDTVTAGKRMHLQDCAAQRESSHNATDAVKSRNTGVHSTGHKVSNTTVVDGASKDVGSRDSDGRSSNGERVRGEVRRLLRERAELIATGVYTRQDEIVAQMDRKIAQLLRSAGLSEAAGTLAR